MTNRRLGVRTRLALSFAAALALIIAVFSGTVWLLLRQSLFSQLDRQLRANLNFVAKTMREEMEDEEEDATPSRLDLDDIREMDHRLGAIRLRIKKDGKTIYESPADDWLNIDLPARLSTVHAPAAFTRWSADGNAWRVVAGKLSLAGSRFDVLVARRQNAVDRSIKTLTAILLIGLPCAFVLALFGGYWMAGRALSPVGAMAAKAREITAESLSERLPVENPADEFGQLATVFNETLSRLEESFARLRRFTADASHELRTPLTAIRSVGEVGLQDCEDPKKLRDVIGSMLEETDRLARLVDRLLILSRADSGRIRLRPTTVDLSSLAKDVVDCLRVLAEEKQQQLRVLAESPVVVECDQESVRMALMNLVDNAIKYTPEGGDIDVSVSDNFESVFIEVRDTGPGIPEEHRARVFERFYRIDPARSRESGGTGLGLAIAQWAINANGGRIELEPAGQSGCIFRIILPKDEGGDDQREKTS